MDRTLAALLLALLPVPLWAGKIKTVTISASPHYEKAELRQVVVSSEGRVSLSRMVRPLPLQAPLDAARVWDAIEDRAGNLFLATGDDGRIFKISSDGQISIAYESGDSQVLCLVAADDGSLYAGTGPRGLIVQIDPNGKAKVFHDSDQRYVWALARDAKTGELFAATGPNGRILKLMPDGTAETFFQSKQSHILCLARGDDGTLFAGTDKQGLVYRFDAAGKGYVLFQAPQAEVRCLQAVGTALYVGTSAPGTPRGIALSSPPAPATGRTADSADPLKPSGPERASEPKTELASGMGNDRVREGEKPVGSSATPPPTAGENSVYRLGLDGSVRELFREKGLVLSLLKLGDRLILGTGSKGQLFEVHEATRERSEIARLETGQILRLVPRRDGSLLLATGDPARLFVLQDRFADRGTLLSEVIDAKLVSRWGTLSWHAHVPIGTRLSVAVRGGNVAEPDETWSDWSAELLDPSRSIAAIPPARFAQFRVSFATTDPTRTPTLQHLTMRYATLNQAPEITHLDTPTAEAIAASKEPKRVRFKWTATDANEDDLVFDLFVRKEGWPDWVRIEEGFGKTEYEWDTTTMPSGSYQFKVVASDRPDNNEAHALTGERISGPVLVAHEAPAVELKVVGIDQNRALFEANAASAHVRLAAATFALNSGKWSNLFPIDHLFDSREETFRFRSETLEPGTHVMVLRVRDAAGNVGTADVVFEVKRGNQ